MLLPKYCQGRMLHWTNACKCFGSQLLHFNNLCAKSHIVSDMIPHSNGQGAPPNVRQSVMMVIALFGSCVTVFRAAEAVSAFLQKLLSVAAVDQCARRPFPALVMGKSVFWYNSP